MATGEICFTLSADAERRIKTRAKELCEAVGKPEMIPTIEKKLTRLILQDLEESDMKSELETVLAYHSEEILKELIHTDPVIRFLTSRG